jgi:hypothetical protein
LLRFDPTSVIELPILVGKMDPCRQMLLRALQEYFNSGMGSCSVPVTLEHSFVGEAPALVQEGLPRLTGGIVPASVDNSKAGQIEPDAGRGYDSEFYQCGQKAAAALAALFYAILHPVTCSPTGQDQYGRTLAVCHLGSPGPDLGQWLVSNGRALDWQQYSKGKYEAARPRDLERQFRRALEVSR